MDFNVYALYSKKLNTIYIGQSKDLNNRVDHHNKGYSTFTSKTDDWVLVYSESCESRSVAYKREKQLKSAGGRKFIWDLVKSKFQEVVGPS